ncbi:thymidylate synthase [Nonlabens antarcticus]|uniref:thymidylate synthase n=1 Tax=Nonlabens antarcticus TaxID=392714 RepID=UPI0018913934|nr:thymidylate synthase [Nonlabens antarcticus]
MKPEFIQTLEFGTLQYYRNYVIGTVNADVVVDDVTGKIIIDAVKQHFGKRPMVYISNREFGREVDLSVYKLIDPKKMIAIAIVSAHRESIIPTAGKEQAAYKGSFGVFKSLDSAVSWAESFIIEEVTEDDNH